MILSYRFVLIQLLKNHFSLLAKAVNGSSEAKVTHFNGAILVQENVRWLEVSVQYLALMQVLDSVQQIPKDGLDVKHFQVQATLNELLQVTLAEFKDHIDLVELFNVVWYDQVDQPDDARVLQLPQKHNLSEHSLAIDRIAEDVVHPFNRDSLARRQLDGLCHVPVAARAQKLLNLVILACAPVGELWLFGTAKLDPLPSFASFHLLRFFFGVHTIKVFVGNLYIPIPQIELY